jgi:hypothetical protein
MRESHLRAARRCGLVVRWFFRDAWPRAPAEDHRGDDQRCGERKYKKRSQQYPVMPEFNQHGFFLSCSRMGAEGFTGKEKARQIRREAA